MINNHTRTLKLERREALDILIALDAASEEGTKWEVLAVKIREPINGQNEKDPAIIELHL